MGASPGKEAGNKGFPDGRFRPVGPPLFRRFYSKCFFIPGMFSGRSYSGQILSVLGGSFVCFPDVIWPETLIAGKPRFGGPYFPPRRFPGVFFPFSRMRIRGHGVVVYRGFSH